MRTIELDLEETVYLRGLLKREKSALEAKLEGLKSQITTNNEIASEIKIVLYDLAQVKYIEYNLY